MILGLFHSFMLLVALCVVFATVVLGQIDAGQFPQACQSQCQSLLDLAQTCTSEYQTSGNPPPSSACVCSGLSNLNYGPCTTCLNTNDQQLGQVISGLSSYCTQAINACAFECGFPTCSSSDVGCQCAESYLQEIYNCAACNTAHGNRNATVMSDYSALRDSCVHQGYTSTPSMTEAIPSPSGTISYTEGSSHAAGSTSPTSTTLTTLHRTSTVSVPTAMSASGSMNPDSTATSFSTLNGAARRSTTDGITYGSIILAIIVAGAWF